MISKMRYKTFIIEALSDGCPFICLGSPIRTTSTFSLENNLLKGMAVALGWLLIKL
jgi:hypothetical protein